jgi:hypothetical protein
MVNVRPMAPFLHLYPFDVETVMEIAYYFEFDYADGRRDDTYAREAVDLVRAWMAEPATGMLSQTRLEDGALFLEDTRQTTTTGRRTATLRGWKAAVFLACDRAQPLRVLAGLPEVEAERVSEDELRAFLGRCVENNLVVRSETAWLNVAVHVPAREEAPARRDERYAAAAA